MLLSSCKEFSSTCKDNHIIAISHRLCKTTQRLFGIARMRSTDDQCSSPIARRNPIARCDIETAIYRSCDQEILHERDIESTTTHPTDDDAIVLFYYSHIIVMRELSREFLYIGEVLRIDHSAQNLLVKTYFYTYFSSSLQEILLYKS